MSNGIRNGTSVVTRLLRRMAVGLAMLALAGGATAADGGVEIHHPWARATIGAQKNGAVYFVIVNRGEADRLIGAAADVARKAELHTHIKDGDIMRMRPLGDLAVPAGTELAFQPGGNHVMLMGLDAPLKEGDKVAVTLRFERAGTIEIEADVLAVGARGPADMMRQHHGGQNMEHHGGQDKPSE